MPIEAIIPTAGMGVRFENPLPKTLVSLSGQPMFCHTLQAFDGFVDRIVLVVPQAFQTQFSDALAVLSLTTSVEIVIGGATRRESVFNGLQAVEQWTEKVLVHDGARPLVSRVLIERIIAALNDHQAVIPGVTVKSTIKKVNEQGFVERSLNRSTLIDVQTPQGFDKELLLKAHTQQQDGVEATDDAMLVEALGVKVKVIEGDERNIKITTPEDLVVGETILKTIDKRQKTKDKRQKTKDKRQKTKDSRF